MCKISPESNPRKDVCHYTKLEHTWSMTEYFPRAGGLNSTKWRKLKRGTTRKLAWLCNIAPAWVLYKQICILIIIHRWLTRIESLVYADRRACSNDSSKETVSQAGLVNGYRWRQWRLTVTSSWSAMTIDLQFSVTCSWFATTIDTQFYCILCMIVCTFVYMPWCSFSLSFTCIAFISCFIVNREEWSLRFIKTFQTRLKCISIL